MKSILILLVLCLPRQVAILPNGRAGVPAKKMAVKTKVDVQRRTAGTRLHHSRELTLGCAEAYCVCSVVTSRKFTVDHLALCTRH